MSKNKHLTLENRITIQTELNKGTSFKGIASLLAKECTTISKEIRNHIHYEKSSAAEPAVSVLITAPPILNTPVQNLTPPYVCNPCKDRARCSLEKGRVKNVKFFMHPYLCKVEVTFAIDLFIYYFHKLFIFKSAHCI